MFIALFQSMMSVFMFQLTDWKNVRRAFKKLDPQNGGYVTIPEFRSVLRLSNVLLSEDELYHVLSEFDEDLLGKIDYNKFLGEIFRPSAKERHLMNIN